MTIGTAVQITDHVQAPRPRGCWCQLLRQLPPPVETSQTHPARPLSRCPENFRWRRLYRSSRRMLRRAEPIVCAAWAVLSASLTRTTTKRLIWPVRDMTPTDALGQPIVAQPVCDNRSEGSCVLPGGAAWFEALALPSLAERSATHLVLRAGCCWRPQSSLTRSRSGGWSRAR